MYTWHSVYLIISSSCSLPSYLNESIHFFSVSCCFSFIIVQIIHTRDGVLTSWKHSWQKGTGKRLNKSAVSALALLLCYCFARCLWCFPASAACLRIQTWQRCLNSSLSMSSTLFTVESPITTVLLWKHSSEAPCAALRCSDTGLSNADQVYESPLK